MWNRSLLPVLVALGALHPAAGALEAQEPGDTVVLYEREVFEYRSEGRPDPFRSLLTNPELGMRFEDLMLVGVLHHPDPSRSVAVLSQTGSTRRIRARVGDRVGGIRIVSIRPRGVDVIVEEFGVARRESLELRPTPERGGTR